MNTLHVVAIYAGGTARAMSKDFHPDDETVCIDFDGDDSPISVSATVTGTSGSAVTAVHQYTWRLVAIDAIRLAFTILRNGAGQKQEATDNSGAVCSSCGTFNEYAESSPGFRCYSCRMSG